MSLLLRERKIESKKKTILRSEKKSRYRLKHISGKKRRRIISRRVVSRFKPIAAVVIEIYRRLHGKQPAHIEKPTQYIINRSFMFVSETTRQ